MNTPKHKNALALCLLSLVFLAGAFCVAAQETAIEKVEFDKMVSKAEENLKGISYRSKIVFEGIEGDESSPFTRTEIVTEIVPPDRSRYLTIHEKNGKTEKRESINIGPRTWSRFNDGAWERLEGLTSGSAIDSGGTRITYSSYKIIEKPKSAQQVAVYEKVQKFEDLPNDNTRRIRIVTERYWVAADGRFLKRLYEMETVGAKKLRRTVTIYEYDPNIKIEAPIK